MERIVLEFDDFEEYLAFDSWVAGHDNDALRFHCIGEDNESSAGSITMDAHILTIYGTHAVFKATGSKADIDDMAKELAPHFFLIPGFEIK